MPGLFWVRLGKNIGTGPKAKLTKKNHATIKSERIPHNKMLI